MKQYLIVLFVLMAACPLLAADPPPPPLTLAQVLALFRSSSPALAVARAHYEALQANEVTAKLRPNPELSFANEDFDFFHLSQFHVANLQEFTDSLNWTIERGGKRAARLSSARWDSTVAGHNLRDQQRQLELQLKTAFVNHLLAKAVLKLAQGNLADYERTVGASQLRLQAGDISQTDFDRIKLREVSFQSDLLNAQLQLAQARAQLAEMLAVPLAPAFDITGTLDPPSLRLSAGDLEQLALANRPDYLAAVAGISKANADNKLAIANGATDLNLVPEYKRNGSENTLGVTLQFPLRIFDRNQGEKLRTSRELAASRFAETVVRLHVLSDVQQAWEIWRAADTRAHLYSSDYLQRARAVRERIEFSYQHGATNLLDFLDAIRSYRRTQLDAVTADAQVWLAVHQLSAATGTEVLP